MVESKSDRMRRLFAEGRTVSEVAKLIGVDYAFAYGVARRGGFAESAARRRGSGSIRSSGVGASDQSSWTRRMVPPPTLADLARARTQYKQVEPRDLFYRAATDLLARARAPGSVLNLGEALAVLLFTWNQAFYRYHPPGAEHITAIEELLSTHASQLDAASKHPLASFDQLDHTDIDRIFQPFEQLLGPVGAAKALHLLAPSFFPIWDRRIAARYVGELRPRGANASRYEAFMTNTAAQCKALANVAGAPVDVVKALDEWNYVRITRGLA